MKAMASHCIFLSILNCYSIMAQFFLCYLFDNIMNMCELKPNPRISILLLSLFLSISPKSDHPDSFLRDSQCPEICVFHSLATFFFSFSTYINMFTILLDFIFSLNSFFDTRASYHILPSRTYSPQYHLLISYILHIVQFICFSIAV